MRVEKWLVFSIIMLSLSILASGSWIGNSILTFQKPSQHDFPVLNSNLDILSQSEAAAFLKISDDKLKVLVENSKSVDGKGIPYYKMGEKLQFSRTALVNWIIYISEEHHEY